MANGNNNGMVPVLVPPQFAKFMAEFFGDKRNVLWPVANISKLPLPLDVAQPFAEKEIEGDFIYADSDSTGTIYVRFNNPAMPEIPVRTNFGIYGFPIRRIFVRWDAQAGKTVNLLYGYGAQIIPPNQDITTIGSITNPVNLDPEDARYFLFGDDESADGEAFIGGSPVAPVAAQVGFVQLFNPAGSGRILYVDAAQQWDGTAADRMELRRHNAAIGAVVATLTNKNAGGAAPLAEVRFGTTAAIAGTLVGVYAALANTMNERKFKAPLRIPEGFGYHFNSFTVNHSIGITYEWREKLT